MKNSFDYPPCPLPGQEGGGKSTSGGYPQTPTKEALPLWTLLFPQSARRWALRLIAPALMFCVRDNLFDLCHGLLQVAAVVHHHVVELTPPFPV